MQTQWPSAAGDAANRSAPAAKEAPTLEHLGTTGNLVLPLYRYPAGATRSCSPSAEHGTERAGQGRDLIYQLLATDTSLPRPAKKPKVEDTINEDAAQPRLLGDLCSMDSDHSCSFARCSSSISSAGVVPTAGPSSPTLSSSRMGCDDQDDTAIQVLHPAGQQRSLVSPGSQMQRAQLQSTPSAATLYHDWSSGSLSTLAGSSSSGGLSILGSTNTSTSSSLHTALCALWEDAQDRGLFRYNVQQECRSRVMPGRLGFVAQLNEGRSTKKRPTEFAVDKVLQPFNASKFHFGKANVQEALMQFEASTPSSVQAAPAPYTASGRRSNSGTAAVPQAMQGLPGAPETPSVKPCAEALLQSDGPCLVDSAPASSSSTLLLINVSPIEYGHVLLVPRALERLPQQLDAEGVAVGQALALAREVDSSDFRVGYNSLGAFATINHLHFQGYFLPHRLPCERAADQLLAAQQLCQGSSDPLDSARTSAGIQPRVSRLEGYPARTSAGIQPRVSRLEGYPVRGFVLHAGDPGQQEAMAQTLGRAAAGLQAANIPFNLLITDCGARAFLFPQCYAERQAAGQVDPGLLDCGVNPATFEIAGHLILKRQEDYDGASEEWACRLLQAVSLDESSFAKVEAICFGTSLAC